MATKIGNSYTTRTTTDSVKILTASQWFTTMVSPNKVSPSDCDNDRQPEMALWPLKPEILISLELWKDNNSIGKSGVLDYAQLEETVPGRLRQPPTTWNLANLLSSWTSSKIPNLALEFRRYLSEFQRCNYFLFQNVFWRSYRYFRLLVAVVPTCQNYFPPIHFSYTSDMSLEFYCSFHSFRDMSISGFGRHFRLSVIIGIA